MAQAQAECDGLAAMLADPGCYEASRQAELQQLLARQKTALAALADAETRWLAAGEALEALLA